MKDREKICILCNENIKRNGIKLVDSYVCSSCFHKFKVIFKSFKIDDIDCFAIYSYNSHLEEILYQIKASKDVHLSQIFLPPFKSFLELKYKDFTIIPVPSSSAQDLKRGFNHVVEIFKVLDLKMKRCIFKKDTYKQSNQTKFQRGNVSSHLYLSQKLDPNKKYLIVDDVTTTHETLKASIKLLKSQNIKQIKILVISLKERK